MSYRDEYSEESEELYERYMAIVTKAKKMMEDSRRVLDKMGDSQAARVGSLDGTDLAHKAAIQDPTQISASS